MKDGRQNSTTGKQSPDATFDTKNENNMAAENRRYIRMLLCVKHSDRLQMQPAEVIIPKITN